jgi:hypothetical protein
MLEDRCSSESSYDMQSDTWVESELEKGRIGEYSDVVVPDFLPELDSGNDSSATASCQSESMKYESSSSKNPKMWPTYEAVS